MNRKSGFTPLHPILIRLNLLGVTGFTLVELVVAVTMAAFVLMAAAGLIVLEYNNYARIQDNTRAAREALLVTNHMTDILRFASDITITPPAPGGAVTTIDAALPDNAPSDPFPFPGYDLGSNVSVTYDHSTVTNMVRFQAAVLAWNVTGFQAAWNAGNRELILDITVTRNRAVVTLHTMIKVLN